MQRQKKPHSDEQRMGDDIPYIFVESSDDEPLVRKRARVTPVDRKPPVKKEQLDRQQPAPSTQRTAPQHTAHQHLILEHATGNPPADDIDFDDMAALNLKTWDEGSSANDYQEQTVCPMCSHPRFEARVRNRRPRWPMFHMDPKTFAFHLLRDDCHREFLRWEKIVMLGLILQRCRGVRERMFTALEKCSVRRKYEHDLDINKIADSMVNEQKVRRDFMTFVNTAATSLKTKALILPDQHLCG